MSAPKDSISPISQRKLSQITTKPWNSQKFSPSKISRYTVIHERGVVALLLHIWAWERAGLRSQQHQWLFCFHVTVCTQKKMEEVWKWDYGYRLKLYRRVLLSSVLSYLCNEVGEVVKGSKVESFWVEEEGRMRAGEGVARSHMTCYVGMFIRLGGLHDLRETKSSTQHM